MAGENAEWTGTWAMRSLEKHDNVEHVRLLDPQTLEIIRKRHSAFLAGTIATPCVKRSSLYRFRDGQFVVQFVANIPAESYWTGEAIEFAERQSMAFGGLGDLLTAVGVADVSRYKSKESIFVERVLRQHTKVDIVERVHDRKYFISRYGLDDVVVVFLNEYELTADHVRTARDRYGPFTDILITNPNGDRTASALRAADSMGAHVFKLGEFLGRLNR